MLVVLGDSELCCMAREDDPQAAELIEDMRTICVELEERRRRMNQ